ncbi:MAG: rRNA maturation RNase YbeY [Treponema sp.]|jgi:probable rRNA maturation factor|nr:rRNA maturation RNase YbeY [Treponema sp.]
MNRVEISAGEIPLPAWAGAAERFVLRILEKIGRDGWDLSLLFCNNACIRSLNARYRQRDEPTDILSFPMGETLEGEEGEPRYLSGDIVISLETWMENARFFGIAPDEELRRLLIHGILHLDGMDHLTNEETEPMLLLQEEILKSLPGERILPLSGPGNSLTEKETYEFGFY